MDSRAAELTQGEREHHVVVTRTDWIIYPLKLKVARRWGQRFQTFIPGMAASISSTVTSRSF